MPNSASDDLLSGEPLATPNARTPNKAAAVDARRAAMTPQEQALVNELFDRLAKLESSSRDRDAERLITDGLRQAPHVVSIISRPRNKILWPE